MKLLLMQYTKDETHINPESIEFVIAQNGQGEAEIHFRSGAVLTIDTDCFLDLLNQLDGTGDYAKGVTK